MDIKLRDGATKWILRQVLYRHVPPALVERPKMGFGLPIGVMAAGVRSARGPRSCWPTDRLRRQGLLDPGPVAAGLAAAPERPARSRPTSCGTCSPCRRGWTAGSPPAARDERPRHDRPAAGRSLPVGDPQAEHPPAEPGVRRPACAAPRPPLRAVSHRRPPVAAGLRDHRDPARRDDLALPVAGVASRRGTRHEEGGPLLRRPLPPRPALVPGALPGSSGRAASPGSRPRTCCSTRWPRRERRRPCPSGPGSSCCCASRPSAPSPSTGTGGGSGCGRPSRSSAPSSSRPARLEVPDELVRRGGQSTEHVAFSYVSRGEYAPQLRRWFDAVGRDRILVLESEQLYTDPATVGARVLDWLHLAPHDRPVPAANRAERSGPGERRAGGAVAEALRAPQPGAVRPPRLRALDRPLTPRAGAVADGISADRVAPVRSPRATRWRPGTIRSPVGAWPAGRRRAAAATSRTARTRPDGRRSRYPGVSWSREVGDRTARPIRGRARRRGDGIRPPGPRRGRSWVRRCQPGLLATASSRAASQQARSSSTSARRGRRRAGEPPSGRR